MKTKSMNTKQYQAFLAKLAKAGFQVSESCYLTKRCAEVYQYGQWTVQVGAYEPNYDEVCTVFVETFFDSEAMDYRAQYRTFPADQSEQAIAYALKQVRSLRGDILSEAYLMAEAD